jgi:hypothetical protein
MPFGLCNAPTTYQKVVTKTFNKYLNDFMQVLFDYFNVLIRRKTMLGNCKNVCKNATSMG